MNNTENVPNNAPDCETLRDLLPAYAFGLTDAEETQWVERMLSQCPEVTTDLEDYRDMAAAMPASAPPVVPPDDLFARVQAAIEDEPAPAVITVPDERVSPSFSLDDHHPGRTSQREAAPTPVPTRRWLFPVTAAALLALVAVNVLLLATGGQLLSRQQSLQAQVQSQTDMLTLIASGEVLRFDLADQRAEGGTAWASVWCNPEQQVALIRTGNFPELDADNQYQVWLWAEGERTNGGALRVAEDGSATLVIEAPLPMGQYEYIAIAPERVPDGQPEPLVRGALYPLPPPD